MKHNKKVSVSLNIVGEKLPKEARYYFTYRFSNVKLTKLSEENIAVTFVVGGELTHALESGFRDAIEHNMSLFEVDCHNWEFKEL